MYFPNAWRWALFGVALAAVLPLTGCKIVSLSEQGSQQGAGFDATAYALDIWAEKAIPFFVGSSNDAGEVLTAIVADLPAAGAAFGSRSGEGSPWTFVISGGGVVSAVNTQSRAGTMTLRLDGATLPTEATVQIGPVIRGTSIRDALPFVSFQDFTNQTEFADAAKALTALAYEGFLPDLADIAVGETVKFLGTVSMASPSDKVLVTLITLEKVAP